MSTGTLITVIVPIAVVVVLLALAMSLVMRRRRLRERFGPEYERAVQATDSRFAAERELSAREKRHDSLNIKPLPSAARDRYSHDWAQVQEEFVDSPEEAVCDADRLVTTLMQERGYPTEGYEQRLKDLSVEHGGTLEHYRTAHEIDLRSTRHKATTEELRSAMVHYRALFQELLSDGGQPRPVGA